MLVTMAALRGACGVVGSKHKNSASTGLWIPCPCNGIKMARLSDDIESLVPRVRGMPAGGSIS